MSESSFSCCAFIELVLYPLLNCFFPVEVTDFPEFLFRANQVFLIFQVALRVVLHQIDLRNLRNLATGDLFICIAQSDMLLIIYKAVNPHL